MVIYVVIMIDAIFIIIYVVIIII